MWMFIGLLSLVAMFVFLIMSLVAKIKKTGKAKKMLLSAGGCFVLLIAAVSFDGPPETQTASTDVKEESKEEKEKAAKEKKEAEAKKAEEAEEKAKSEEEAKAKKAEEDAAKKAKLKPEQEAKAKAEAEAKKKAEKEAKAKAATEEEAKKKAEAAKPENVVKKAVVKAIGKKNNRDEKAKVTKVAYNEQSGTLTVEFKGDENLTNNMTIGGVQMDIEKTMEAVRKSKADYKELNIVVTYSMVDKLGNAEEMEVISLVYYKETIDKINFDNFLFENVYDVTDIPGFVHPAFQKKQ